jgi:hypothetical protein
MFFLLFCHVYKTLKDFFAHFVYKRTGTKRFLVSLKKTEPPV